MMGAPSSVQSAWLLQHGEGENAIVDTLHLGLWNAEPQAGWHVGFGHLWLQKEPLWADRITASIHLSRHRLEETFIGQIKGMGADTSVAFVDDLIRASAQATSASAELQTMRALATGPEGFVEWRTGLRGAFMISQSQTTVSDNFFSPAELPSWHVALTMGIGAGFKVYRGRMFRLTLDADVLQLAKASQVYSNRFVESRMRGLDWLQSGYRPWRLTLHHDLYRRKPELGCAAPTRSDESKTLFDPSMKGIGKAKHKGRKKKKS